MPGLGCGKTIRAQPTGLDILNEIGQIGSFADKKLGLLPCRDKRFRLPHTQS